MRLDGRWRWRAGGEGQDASASRGPDEYLSDTKSVLAAEIERTPIVGFTNIGPIGDPISGRAEGGLSQQVSSGTWRSR